MRVTIFVLFHSHLLGAAKLGQGIEVASKMKNMSFIL
jgi:hypothetical protein